MFNMNHLCQAVGMVSSSAPAPYFKPSLLSAPLVFILVSSFLPVASALGWPNNTAVKLYCRTLHARHMDFATRHPDIVVGADLSYLSGRSSPLTAPMLLLPIY